MDRSSEQSKVGLLTIMSAIAVLVLATTATEARRATAARAPPCIRRATLCMALPEDDALAAKLNALYEVDEMEPYFPAECTEMAGRVDDALAALYEVDATETYLQTGRAELAGRVDSHALLEQDREAGVFPPRLSPDAKAEQMVFVDEPRCIGCGYCAQVARSTFALNELGLARAYDQGSDELEVSSRWSTRPSCLALFISLISLCACR